MFTGGTPDPVLRFLCLLGVSEAQASLLSQAIERAFHPAAALAQHVGVDHRGGNVVVAQQLLDRADIGPALQGMRGETVAKSVRAGVFRDPYPHHRRLDGLVNRGLVQVVPTNHA